MNMELLFDTQRKLDERIFKEHGVKEEDVLIKRILALQVELGEFANATRCFKYWSNKPPMSREEQLEEFVDCLHFLLSIGNTLKVFPFNSGIEIQSKDYSECVEVGLVAFLSAVPLVKSEEDWLSAFCMFLDIGRAFGFKEDEIIEAYLKKNEVNHARQDEGY